MLVTCGTRQESQCIKESLLLLSEFAEKLIPGLFDDGRKDDEGSTADKAKVRNSRESFLVRSLFCCSSSHLCNVKSVYGLL